MALYTLLSLVVAAIALLLALIWFRRSRSTRKKQTRFQNTPAPTARFRDRPLAADARRGAQSQLRVELVGSPSERRFVFSNLGPGVARNVSFTFADLGDWSPPVIAPQFAEIFPISEFRPTQQYSCIATLHLGHPPVLTGIFTWQDDDGAPHRTRCEIPAGSEV